MLLFKRKSDLASSWFNCLSAPTRSACPSLPTNFNDEWHALLIHQCMQISYYTHILINATTLCHFMLLCATLLSLCARLRPFTLLYATLLYFTVFRHIALHLAEFALPSWSLKYDRPRQGY